MKHQTKDQEAKTGSAVEHQDAGRFTADQMAHVKNFIQEVGGVENARAAIEALEKLRTAA